MSPDTPTIRSDFDREFIAAQDALMRRRLTLYLVVSCVLNVVGVGITLLGAALATAVLLIEGVEVSDRGAMVATSYALWVSFVLSLPAVAAYFWALVRVRRRPIDYAGGLRLVFWVIVAPTLFALVFGLLAFEAGPDVFSGTATTNPTESLGWSGVASVFLAHFFACLFLPWSPWESVRPMIPIVGTTALISLYTMWGDWGQFALVTGAMIGVMLPGTALCWLKSTRFTKRFVDRKLRDTYGVMKHELSAARQIHDAMFPEPVTDGPVRIDYRYEPMRQIGGDYVFVRADESAIDLVVIDVTGHGVGAALTVNRLHGEVQRLLAERPGCGPGELLGGLNRYLHITLARHSVYATAQCFRFSLDQQRVRFANAGHPPAFMVREGLPLERLDSTTFLLGVCHPDDFDAQERELEFAPGDRLVAYTDGATEALDADGRQLRVGGLEAMVDSLPRGEGAWIDAILAGVDAHRAGPPQDDTLIVEVRRVGYRT
ncbi:MAG: hypothetical protein Tsb0013_21870 [Phycisphaerales bacterium]